MPLVGRLELADHPLGRAGERALLVAEQLALQQRLGQGGAVEADERPVPPRAARVDRPGDQFLADAALAADQHRRLRLGHAARPATRSRASASLSPTSSLSTPKLVLEAPVLGRER